MCSYGEKADRWPQAITHTSLCSKQGQPGHIRVVAHGVATVPLRQEQAVKPSGQ
jgi:hypothetical protein